jgi:hypothetical protein
MVKIVRVRAIRRCPCPGCPRSNAALRRRSRVSRSCASSKPRRARHHRHDRHDEATACGSVRRVDSDHCASAAGCRPRQRCKPAGERFHAAGRLQVGLSTSVDIRDAAGVPAAIHSDESTRSQRIMASRKQVQPCAAGRGGRNWIRLAGAAGVFVACQRRHNAQSGRGRRLPERRAWRHGTQSDAQGQERNRRPARKLHVHRIAPPSCGAARCT